MEKQHGISSAFQMFLSEASGYSGPWMEAVKKLDAAKPLDDKTKELAYIAVLAATRMESGVPFHVKMAKEHGATRDEVIASVMIGLPAAGQVVIQVLPAALAAYRRGFLNSNRESAKGSECGVVLGALCPLSRAGRGEFRRGVVCKGATLKSSVLPLPDGRGLG